MLFALLSDVVLVLTDCVAIVLEEQAATATQEQIVVDMPTDQQRLTLIRNNQRRTTAGHQTSYV